MFLNLKFYVFIFQLPAHAAKALRLVAVVQKQEQFPQQYHRMREW